MAQLDPITVGDVPVDLTAGLAPGCFIGQARSPGDVGILVATSLTAPTDDSFYFNIRGKRFFRFDVLAEGHVPTWAKSPVVGLPNAVAIASQ